MEEMKESSKEGVVSSLQTIEGALGVGDFLSSGVEQFGQDDEEAEEGPEEHELDTGVTVTVITDEEVAEPEGSQTSRCRSVLIVLGALFALPVVNVFPQVLRFSLDGLASEAAGALTSEVPGQQGGESEETSTVNPAYVCEMQPWLPICKDLYGSSYEWSWLSDEAAPPAYLAWLCPRDPDHILCQPTTTTSTTTTTPLENWSWPSHETPPAEFLTWLCPRHPDNTLCQPEPTTTTTTSWGNFSWPSHETPPAEYLVWLCPRYPDNTLCQPETTTTATTSDLYGSSYAWFWPPGEAPSPEYLAWFCPRNPDDILCRPATTTATTTTIPGIGGLGRQRRSAVCRLFAWSSACRSWDGLNPKSRDNAELVNSEGQLLDKAELVDSEGQLLENKVLVKNEGQLLENKKLVDSNGQLLEIAKLVHSNGQLHENGELVESKGQLDGNAKLLNSKKSLDENMELADSKGQLLENAKLVDSNGQLAEHVELVDSNGQLDTNAELVDSMGKLHENGELVDSKERFNEVGSKGRFGMLSKKPTYFEKISKKLNRVMKFEPVASTEREFIVSKVDSSSNPMDNLKKIQTTLFDKEYGPKSQQETESEIGSATGPNVAPSEKEKGDLVQFQMAEWGLKRLSRSGVGRSRRRRKRSAGSDGENFQVVEDTYDVVYALFGIVSGISIVAFNYRVTAAVGGAVAGLACLVAPFLPRNRHALAFVLGALPAIGHNLVVTSVWVALLEHFRQRRLMVLSVTEASSALATVVFFFVQAHLFPALGIGPGDVRSILLYQAATYLLCVLGALALVPRNLHVKGDDPVKETLRGRMLDISGLRLFKSPLLYLLAAVFFFDSLGSGIPKTHVEQASGIFLLSHFLFILIAIGAFFGSLLSCCVSRKADALSLVVSLLVVAALGVLMAAFTLAAAAALDVLDYAVSYCLLFGVFAGLRTPLLIRAIPLTLGEEHLGLVFGTVSFASGLGSIIGDASAVAIASDLNRVDGAFYLAGVSLLASSAACLLLINVKRRVTAEASVTSPEVGNLTSAEIDRTWDVTGSIKKRTEA